MRKDPDIAVQRIARAIEKVFLSDGRIDGSRIFSRRDLRKIGEAMARKSSDPSRYVNQGFHNTSLSQCILRQELETNPAQVMEMIASVVTSGKAFLGAGQRGRLVVVDKKNLALDLEARLATDEMVSDLGIRDAVGQFFDLLLTQAFWDQKSNEQFRYHFVQDQNLRSGFTGERLLKVDARTNIVIKQIYEGPQITVGDSYDMVRLFDETGYALLVHKSLLPGGDRFCIADESELIGAARHYKSLAGRPVILLVFAGLLPGAGRQTASRGHDLHAVTAYCTDENIFYIESRWGSRHDLDLLGLTASDVLLAMTMPQSVNIGAARAIAPVQAPQLYDEIPPDQRIIDPAHPVHPGDRAPQLMQLQIERDRLEEIERRALSNPMLREQEKYFEALEAWEAKRAEHLSVFGDALPFNVPPPSPPSTPSSF